MVTMNRTVRKIEQKMRNYRASSLSLRAGQIQAGIVDDPNASTLKSKLMRICSGVFRNESTSARSNSRNRISQKRVVLYMAMCYSLTWALTWIPIYVCNLLSGMKPQSLRRQFLPISRDYITSPSTCHQR